MSWSFSIGRLFGSDLRIHATFFLLLAWIGTAAWMADGPEAALTNVAFILALFACVVAHEFGHALTARRYGIRTPDITLLPIGGMARLERMPEDPRQEIIVALAGPAVNVVIWVVLTFGLGARIDPDALQALEDPGQGFLARLAAVNLFLAVFNLIPAFPMDGGRVLRAALTIPMGRVKATRTAAQAGQIIAFMFGFFGLTSGNLLLLLIAGFIFMAASAESSDVELHAKARGALVRDAMITSYEALSPTDTMALAAQTIIRTTQAEIPIVDADGHLHGILTRQAVIAGFEHGDRMGSVSGAMTADIPSVQIRAPLEEALTALQGANTPAVAVTDKGGHFVGYITRENIGEWMALSVTQTS